MVDVIVWMGNEAVVADARAAVRVEHAENFVRMFGEYSRDETLTDEERAELRKHAEQARRVVATRREMESLPETGGG